MRLCVIHTGGTIGSAMTPLGFAPKAGIVEETLAQLAESGAVTAAYDLVVADPLLDSSQATVADWNWIVAAIAARHDAYDGFVVTHGTDSMGYAAAAVTLALEGLAKPVILTGSMVPLRVAGSDGADNLVAAMAAAETAEPGVWLQFAGQLLPGSRIQKVHSVAHAAFASDGQAVTPRVVGADLRHHVFQRQSLAIVTLSPGLEPPMLTDQCRRADGVILRCFGSGNVPGTAEFRAFLDDLAGRAVPLVAISQCAAGGVVIGTYSASAVLAEVGAINGKDMTLEAAYAKLMLGLSRFAGDDLRQYMETAQAGEIAV
ncbi:asparaginase [Epibacterium sp. SM1979]|uniref:Asparaginase n=1 Tax=Tritonibacter litoralis TaxID=2662264 RepID=A0A843YKW6_9RHOB|nr:asparaginase [Tritonibacter litoralis]MQQ10064.1 asparaginase [Tritonibacter litoralis]